MSEGQIYFSLIMLLLFGFVIIYAIISGTKDAKAYRQYITDNTKTYDEKEKEDAELINSNLQYIDNLKNTGVTKIKYKNGDMKYIGVKDLLAINISDLKRNYRHRHTGEDRFGNYIGMTVKQEKTNIEIDLGLKWTANLSFATADCYFYYNADKIIEIWAIYLGEIQKK